MLSEWTGSSLFPETLLLTSGAGVPGLGPVGTDAAERGRELPGVLELSA